MNKKMVSLVVSISVLFSPIVFVNPTTADASSSAFIMVESQTINAVSNYYSEAVYQKTPYHAYQYQETKGKMSAGFSIIAQDYIWQPHYARTASKVWNEDTLGKDETQSYPSSKSHDYKYTFNDLQQTGTYSETDNGGKPFAGNFPTNLSWMHYPLAPLSPIIPCGGMACIGHVVGGAEHEQNTPDYHFEKHYDHDQTFGGKLVLVTKDDQNPTGTRFITLYTHVEKIALEPRNDNKYVIEFKDKGAIPCGQVGIAGMATSPVPSNPNTCFVRIAVPNNGITDVTPGGGSDAFKTNVWIGADINNCIAISGDGPRKVVFMRGKSWGMSDEDFIKQAKSIISSGFSEIDPYKTYFDKFSFYADMAKYDESKFKLVSNGRFLSYSLDDVISLKVQSSCSPADQYFFYFENPAFERGVSFNKQGFSFITDESATMHEMGHSFAGLYDEYSYSGLDSYERSDNLIPAENCVTDPDIDYRSFVDNYRYGSKSFEGCQYLGPTTPLSTKYYRPTNDSLMNLIQYNSDDRLNVISCGYVVSAILKDVGGLTPRNAQKHWPRIDKYSSYPGCAAMDTILGNQTINYATAVITSDSNITANQGSPLTLTGTNFTATDNAIQINASSGEFYEVLEIPSADTKHITFTIPTSVPVGSYTIKAGAYNSDWSNSVPFTVTSSDIKEQVKCFFKGTDIQQSCRATSTTKGIFLPACKGIYNCTNNVSGVKDTVFTWKSSCNSNTATTTIDGTNENVNFQCSTPVVTPPTPPSAPTPPLPPTATLSASSYIVDLHQPVTITWSSENTTSCTGTRGWSGTKATSGSEEIRPTQTAMYALTCTGKDGSQILPYLQIRIEVNQPVSFLGSFLTATTLLSLIQTPWTWVVILLIIVLVVYFVKNRKK